MRAAAARLSCAKKRCRRCFGMAQPRVFFADGDSAMGRCGNRAIFARDPVMNSLSETDAEASAWMLAHLAPLLVRGWDNEYVVYARASGDTHLLGAAAYRILARLQLARAGRAALCAVVAGACAEDERARCAGLTDAILTDLEALGLIRPCCR